MATVEKLSLPESHRDIILDFIRLILPPLNNIPESYERLKKCIEEPDMKEFLICKGCQNEIKIEPKSKKNALLNCVQLIEKV